MVKNNIFSNYRTKNKTPFDFELDFEFFAFVGVPANKLPAACFFAKVTAMYDYTANYVAGEVNNEGWKKNSSWSKNIFSNSETKNKTPFEFEIDFAFEFIFSP